MKTRFDVVVVGGANMDFLVRGEKLPGPGETVDGREFLKACGGKGANQAVAAARLGARVAFVGCVGRDRWGDEILDSLRQESIDVRGVVRHPKEKTGVALVMVDAKGEKQIIVAPGANHKLAVKHVNSARKLIESSRVLLTQFEIPMSTVLRAAEIARRAGVKVVLDPAPAGKPPGRLLKLINFIRPNSSEAESLTGIRVCDAVSARKAAKILFSRGVEAAAIQAGGEGDLVIWRAKGRRTPSPRPSPPSGEREKNPVQEREGERLYARVKVKAVDATGAGDAFAGAIAVAIAEGRSYEEAGAFANVAAALATTKFGAQTALASRGEVARLMRRAGYGKEAGVFL